MTWHMCTKKVMVFILEYYCDTRARRLVDKHNRGEVSKSNGPIFNLNLKPATSLWVKIILLNIMLYLKYYTYNKCIVRNIVCEGVYKPQFKPY